MKKTNLISLIVFVVILVWVFTLKNETIRAIQAKFLGFFGVVHETAAAVTFSDDLINGEPIDATTIAQRYDEAELSERYSQLLHELFNLRAWESQIDILREENVELKRSLNFVELREAQQRTLIAARVINRASGSWWRTVTIDKGAADGVVLNSPVETPVAVDRTGAVEGALVGKVTVVGERESMVVLATDEECHVAAYVHGVFAESSKGLQRVQGILSGAPGAGTTVPHLVLKNLPKEADRFGVKAGAKVYSAGITTSESQGVFPPGLILGYVKEFEVREIDAEARVTPAIDFNTLSHVFVLVPSAEPTGAEPAVPVATPAATGTRSEPPAPRPLPVTPEALDVPRARRVGEDVD
jgi:rod shape-determining protein MreC